MLVRHLVDELLKLISIAGEGAALFVFLMIEVAVEWAKSLNDLHGWEPFVYVGVTIFYITLVGLVASFAVERGIDIFKGVRKKFAQYQTEAGTATEWEDGMSTKQLEERAMTSNPGQRTTISNPARNTPGTALDRPMTHRDFLTVGFWIVTGGVAYLLGRVGRPKGGDRA